MRLARLPDGENDNQRRFDFIRWTYYVLQSISRERGLIASTLIDQAQSALEDVGEREFARLAEAAGSISDPSVLSAHGLGGTQLAFKLNTVRYWADRANEMFRVGLVGKWRDFIRRLLKAIDTLLDSILKALGVETAVKEVKDAISDAIKDADDNGDSHE